jgi:hypothetical protein
MEISRRAFLGQAAVLPAVTPRGRKLLTIDCTQDLPPESYFSYGPTRIVETPIGRYREAEGKHAARFGYRFKIENPAAPHLALIRYPDDKRRYMCVMDGTTYDLSTGVFAGGLIPGSGSMQVIEHMFWSRFRDLSLAFMTWGDGEPAAAASIEIYELDRLAPLEIPKNFAGVPRREFGIQYEDPCGTGMSEGATDHQSWLDHVIEYARHTGQNRFVYPLAWYHGPLFPSANEPSSGMDCVVGRDRRQYIRWTSHPEDWYARMLERFGREGLQYQASLTLLRLGSLMKVMNTDEEAVQKGADTVNNVLWNGHVQAGTQDWTPLYNVLNYEQVLDFYEQGRDQRDFPWHYGEKARQPYHAGPIFNPLHPDVQRAIVAFVEEIATRYARYPAFKGVSINFWHDTILWFGSLHAGYDDRTVNLFEKETGIQIPVKVGAPDRFQRRYEFLTGTVRPAWIEWRCRKIRDLIRRVRDVVVKARPDLELTLTLWNEMTIPLLLGSISAGLQLHARKSNVEMWREAGLDCALLAGEPGIEVDFELQPQRDASGWGTKGAGTLNSQTHMFRDHDFLDEQTLGAARSVPRSGVFIFNSWVEAWGKHRWFRPEASDHQARELSVMDGSPAEGIFRINSEYPKDGFWWDSQSRITAGMPGGVHFSEHYAHAVAEFDALRITRGGLYLDKAHSTQIRRFAAAFRALPRKKFATVGASTDPVAVRSCAVGGQLYFYAVNREYYPVGVTLRFSKLAGCRNLVTGAALPDSGELLLGPYELVCFTAEGETALTGFDVRVPAEIRAKLQEEVTKALAAIGRVRESGGFIPGMTEMAAGIEAAMREGRVAWLRRALNSYIVSTAISR